MRYNIFLLITFAIFTSGAMSCKADQGSSTFDIEKLSDNLYLVYGGSGRGANVGVYVGDAGIVLVDDMLEAASEDLHSAIQSISSKPITHVINTHGDSDHSGGNSFFADLGATIVSQEKARYGSSFVDSTFDKRMTISLGDETIELHHFISHSFDDAIISFTKSGVIFMGDTFTTRWHPTFNSGGVDGQRDALNLAIQLSDYSTKIVPGHGTVSGPSDLRDFVNRTDNLLNRIRSLHGEGAIADSIAVDTEMNRLLLEFNVDHRPTFVEGDRLLRFMERVISTELVEPVEGLELGDYEGSYSMEDGRMVNIMLDSGLLFAAVEGDFMIELIPRSASEFHPRSWLESQFSFEQDDSGEVARISIRRQEETTSGVRARR